MLAAAGRREGPRRGILTGSSRSYFHSCPAQADPERLLDPERQFTEPWGEPDHGRCDKCDGGGTTVYECRSCIEGGSDPDCPGCQGRVSFRETCPTCLGTGEIDHTRRRGVAVFPTRQGLYRYLAERDAEVEAKIVVEVAGRLSEERDLDADAGALLVLPDRILGAEPLDVARIEEIRRRVGVIESDAPG